MGCPFDASLRFGFKLSKSEASKIEKKINKIEEDFPEDGDWQKLVGDFEPDVCCDEEDKKFYLKLSEVANASNCEFLAEVSEKDLSKARAEAHKIYDTSPFLKENFKKTDIKLLLISDYIG
jgi:hypothetical protein